MKFRYFALALMLIIGCGDTDRAKDKLEQTQDQGDDRMSSETAAKLPRTEELAGFEKASSDQVFTEDGLGDFIGAETDTLSRFGLICAATADYKSTNSELQFSINIFRFRDGSHAFGAYALNRTPDMSFADVGTQGYFDTGRFVFCDSAYLVRIAGYSSSDASDSAALYLAKAIDNHIGGESDFPVAVSLMPDTGQIANTERFFPSDLLDLKFFSPAYTCDYDLGDSVSMLVFIPSGSTAELEQYKEYVAKSENTVREARISNIAVYFYDDVRYGKVIMTSRAGRLVGLVHTPDRDSGLALIMKLWENIDAYTNSSQ